MRLIDADALGLEINRKAHENFPANMNLTLYASSLLAHAPTIDAVPVVRCKDCKHWEEIKHGQGWCTGFAPSDVFSDFNDFCSYGERREGDGR